MAIRLGSFKAKGCQLVIWQRGEQLSFEFGKFYKDKRSGEWKKSNVLFLEELREIGEMFIRAAKWGATKNPTQPLPKNVEPVESVMNNLVTQIKERYERTSEGD